MWAKPGLRSLVTALVVVVLVTACGGSAKSSKTTASNAPLKALIGAGVDLLRQGNSSAAEQLFEQAVARYPNNPVGHYDLGVVLQSFGNQRAALHEYRLAVAYDPQYTPALFNEAILLSAHNPALAIFYYRRIIAAKPDSPTALLNLGLLEDASHWPRRYVLTTLRRAVALDPSLRGDVPAALRRDLAKH